MEQTLPLYKRRLNAIEPYFEIIKQAMLVSYERSVILKDVLFQLDPLTRMKPRTKGCIINDALVAYLKTELSSDPRVKILETRDVSGLLIDGEVFIKFNKMDDNHKPSIQKRKWYKALMNQGQEIEGLGDGVTKLWAAYVPIDREWSQIIRFCLLYFEGGDIVWYNDLNGEQSQQFAIPFTSPVDAPTKRRTTTKNPQEHKKTGTEGK